MFNAATTNVARMLYRDNLGRVVLGAKADLLFWDARSLFMSPMCDPFGISSLYVQAEDPRDVIAGGRWVMQINVVLNVTERDVARRLQFAGERIWAERDDGDWVKRDVDQLSQMSIAASGG
jgi:cytosine/adenosine deaminase-related metal-dependent hydrolase